jgi:hypothetical protein
MKAHHLFRLTRCLFATALGLASTQAGIVRNPSFESNYIDAFPHYGAIDEWTGGSGVNKSDGPFHNNGTPIPDGAQMAFIQGSANLSQDLSGLTAGKQYWIQFSYDARACCGGTIDLQTKINGTVLDNIANVKPATGGSGYLTRTVAFTADSDTATLMFSGVSVGDATVVIDAVSVVQRDPGSVPVANPSFEASGDVADPGLLVNPDTGEPENLGGWTATGQYGINISGTGYADNGTNPDQDHVLFLQGLSSVSQTVNLLVGKVYQLSFAYNARTGNKPHIQAMIGTNVLFEEDVNPVGDTAPYKTKTVSFTATDVTGTISIGQSVDGDQTLLVDNVILVGEAPKPVDPTTLAPATAELSVGEQMDVTVTISADALAVKNITVGLLSSASSVTKFVGTSGALSASTSLTFTKGGPNQQTVKIQALARGTANIQVDSANSGGLPIKNQAIITVVQGALKNPSFESTPPPAGVGYGPIAGWNSVGNAGINTSAGPFADNGIIPDRGQVGFLQGAGTLSQNAQGLIPGKNYWLQFFYNVRNGSVMDLSVNIAGKEVASIKGITPVGDAVPYNFENISFVADSPNPLIEFKTTPTGDSTLLLDAATIVQRDPGQIVVRNPSFEASGSVYPYPGYFNSVGGWDISGGGGRGVNIDGAGPFSDNGRANSGDVVLFMQGAGATVSQNLTGLTQGDKYTIAYLVNARGGGAEDTTYSVLINGASVFDGDITPVGGSNPYYLNQVEFTADATEDVLGFQGTTATGDHTVLFDNIIVLPSAAAPFILQDPASAVKPVGGSASFTVVAIGGGTLTYQWKKDGQPIATQTADTLTLDTLSLANSGTYSVDVKNNGGTVSSTAAHLMVLDLVPGVYDTGLGDDRVVLDDGLTDPHYTLIQNANDTNSTIAFVGDSTIFPIGTGNWYANSDLSKWIEPLTDTAAALPGNYVYRINVDLTGFDPATVILTGNIGTDNSVEIWVNGADTGVSETGFGSLTPVTVSGVFKAGVNHVDFAVKNDGPAVGPTGLRIEGLVALGTKGSVSNQPRITATQTGQLIRLSWPASATGYRLQTLNSVGGTWTDSNLPTTVVGTDNVITDSTSAATARFYRLIK